MVRFNFSRPLRTLLLAAFLLVSGTLAAQSVGIFQTYIVLDVNAGGNQFLAGGLNADGAPSFNGMNLGTVASLSLSGGEAKTFKNGGGDVFGAELNYRIFPQGSPSGTFIPVNLPFESNLSNPGDQRWQELGSNTDLLSGLAAGDYTLEVFWRVPTNQGDQFDSNFGNNFSASFTVAAVTPVPTMSQWGLIIFCLLVLCIGGVVITQRNQLRPTQG